MKRYIEIPKSRIATTGILRSGQSLEEFLRKAMVGNEPIEATAKLTYNERKDGVLPQHDIRTDRWEIAQQQTDKYHRSRAASQKATDFPNPEEIAKAATEGKLPTGEA